MTWHFACFISVCYFVNQILFVQWQYTKKIVGNSPYSVSNVYFKQIIYGKIYQRNQFAKQWLVICKEQMLQSALYGFAYVCVVDLYSCLND